MSIVFTMFCIVFLYCFVYVYLFLFVLSEVTTQLLLVVIIIIIIIIIHIKIPTRGRQPFPQRGIFFVKRTFINPISYTLGAPLHAAKKQVFEPTIPASKRSQTHALDRAANGFGFFTPYLSRYYK